MTALVSVLLPCAVIAAFPPLPAGREPEAPKCPDGTTLHRTLWTGPLELFGAALDDDLLGTDPPVRDGRMQRWECRRPDGTAFGPLRVVLPLGEVLFDATRDGAGKLDGPARYRVGFERVYRGFPTDGIPELAELRHPGCDRVDAVFRAGTLHGPFRCYRRGVLLVSGRLAQGHPDGEWRFADAHGALVGRNVVRSGTGHWIHWDAEGGVAWAGRLASTRWATVLQRLEVLRSR